MKKIFFILCFIWLSITGSAQNDSVIKFQNIIQSFENKEGATTITIAKPMFGLIGKMIKSDELQNIQPLLSQVNSVKMLIIDKAEAPVLETQLNSALKNMKVEELMTINSGTNKIKYLSSGTENDFVKDLMFSINSDEDNILILLDGKIKTEEVQKLINTNTPNPLEKKTSQTNENEDCNCTEDMNDDFEEMNKDLAEMSEELSNIDNDFEEMNETNNSNTAEVIQENKFTSILADFSGELYITKGNDYSIEMQDAKNSSGRKKAHVENGVLIIKGNGNMIVRITVPSINSVEIPSGKAMKINTNFSKENMKIEVHSGAAVSGNITSNMLDLEIHSGGLLKAEIQSVNLSAEIHSGGSAKLSGSASNGSFSVHSGGSLKAVDLPVENLSVDLSGPSTAEVNVTKNLNGTVDNLSILRYKGNPSNINIQSDQKYNNIKKIN